MRDTITAMVACGAISVAGCGSAQVKPTASEIRNAKDLGRTVEPSSESERAVLSRLDALPSSSPAKVGDLVVVAGSAYHAASGRTCRPLQIKHGAAQRSRLACKKEGKWVFVPDIFATDRSGP